MTKRFHACAVLAATAAALALAGCGGGGGGHHDDDALDAVPPSASADTGGFIAYLKKLTGFEPEDREPVAVDAVTPPADDAGEPQPLT